jgi:hypothetical protein
MFKRHFCAGSLREMGPEKRYLCLLVQCRKHSYTAVPKKRGETWVRQMLNRWSWMHSVRTVASGASLLVLAAYYVK